MTASIQIDSLKTMGSSIVEDVNAIRFRRVEDFKAVRGRPLSGTRRRFTAGVGFVFQKVKVTIIDHRPCPGLKRNVINVYGGVQGRAWLVTPRVDGQPAAAPPKTFLACGCTQADSSVRPARHRPRCPGLPRILGE